MSNATPCLEDECNNESFGAGHCLERTSVDTAGDNSSSWTAADVGPVILVVGTVQQNALKLAVGTRDLVRGSDSPKANLPSRIQCCLGALKSSASRGMRALVILISWTGRTLPPWESCAFSPLQAKSQH